MRALLSVLFLLTVSFGAMGTVAGPVSDPAPATETHAPMQAEIEVETEADAATVPLAMAPVQASAALASALSAGQTRGVPPTPPPES